MSDFENSPQELRERDQWLTCDTTGDDRGRPHWRGNTGISWSDPDDWHTFEEAKEVAQERDEWGVGYVFAVDNPRFDGGKYGFIDIDGGLTDPCDIDSVKEWVPDTISILLDDAWGEYSAGKYGAHIPFEGSIPDWWSNNTDDHEGPEAHGNKFCAITGDTIEGCEPADGVFTDDIAPFLLKAYQNWHGEYPELPEYTETFDVGDGDESESKDGDEYDEWLTDDDIEDALGHLDPDMQMDEWWNIGRAIQDYDDGPDGRRLLREWSKTGSKWDEQAPDLLDWVWTKSTPGTKTTLGTLIYLARNEGWDMPSPPGATDSGSDSDSPTNIDEKGGEYGYWSYDEEEDSYSFHPVSNFTLELNALLTLDGEKFFDLDVVPGDVGERYQAQVQPAVFNELRDFKRELATGPATVVKTSSQNVLNDLRVHVANQDAPRLAGVKRLGIHDGEFVTPDGVLDGDGWTDDASHVFIDDGNPLTTTLDIPEEGDEESVGRALELLPQSRDPELFIPVIGWFYATAFRPTILEETGQFNHLAVFGETGAGKTMTTSVLSQMFGMGTNGFNPLDTAFVALRTLSAGRGLPIWYDEYKPAEWSERGRRQFHADLRKAAAGQWARRGNADKSTDGFFLSAPVLLTGEQHLQGSAEQRRTIQTKFSVDATLNDERQNAYYALRDECDLRGHARLFYQWVLQQDGDDVRERWHSAGERINEELDADDIDDMARQGLQTVLFGIGVYRSFAEDIGASPPELPVWDSLSRLTGDTGADARTSHIEEFVGLLGRAAVNGYLEEDTHYTFTSGELRVNVARSHDRVSKFIRDHDLTGVDLFDNPGDYTSRFRDTDADWITCVGQKSPPVSRCVGIDIGECPLLEVGAFADDEEAEGEGDDADTDSGPTQIADLDGGYETIVARVNDVERPNHPDAPTQSGRLVDDSGPIDFVCWARSPFDLAPDEQYRFENVDVGEYNGSPQAELIDGITAVEPVEPAEGHAETSTDGGDDDDDDDEPSQAECIKRTKGVIAEAERGDGGPADHAEVINALLDEGVPQSNAERALDKLSEQGDIYQPENGHFRLNN